MNDDTASVGLLSSPRRSPITLAERSAMSRLAGAGEVSLASVVRAVAHDLYQDALRHGGWAAEIGGAGRGLFASDAAQAMREADGVLWSIRGRTLRPDAEPPRRS